MKIPEQYNKKRYDRGLLVVCNLKKGRIDYIHEGIIDLLDNFTLHEPRYTDRIGFFEKKAGTHVFSSGSLYEERRRMMADELGRVVSKKLSDIISNYEIKKIYFFIPKHLKDTEKKLDRKIKGKIKKTILGNYSRISDLSLMKLLEKNILPN